MGVINEPRYDEDLVTKSYLDSVTDGINEEITRRVQNFGSEPIPPYYVNDTYMNGTDIYICINERLIGAFNASDWSKASNYTDDTLASSMNKVFVNTPTPPYKIGDLWTTGPNGVLYRCKTSKILGESYNIADWENATSYDDTKTTVQNGLVTTGTVQVVNGGTVAAGITGQTSGDTAIRFWAGSTFDNRALTSTPFRVTQGGTLYAKNATIDGNITATTGQIGGWSLSGNNLVCGGTTLNGSTGNINTNSLTATAGTVGGCVIDAYGMYSGSGDSVAGIGLYGARHAFWAGKNANESSSAPFRVGHDGSLYASNATIQGAITVTSGTFANFSGGGLTLNSSGAFKYFDSPGFLYCGGNTTKHPYVSALNVASAYNNSASINDRGISFRDVTWEGNAGNEVGYINVSQNGLGMFFVNREGTLNTKSATATGITAGTYIRIAAGTSTTEGSSSGNLYLAASSYVYASNAAASYSYSRVRTVSGDYSSKNIKKNIKRFKNKDYEKSIDLLKKLNIYDYEYKYKGLYDRQKQYGFIIDEIEKTDNKFFDIKEEKARIKNNCIDFGDPDAKGKKITVKNYNPDVLDKYLLTVCKAQQIKIDELEKRLEKLEEGGK